MICPKCKTIMTEVYYPSSIYFFCLECGKEFEIDLENIFIGMYEIGYDSDYDEPMEEW